MSKIRIYFRQKQLYRDGNIDDPVIVNPKDDGTVEYINGTVDQEWSEMTEFTEGLDNLKFSWQAVNGDATEDATLEGNQFGSNYDKGLSSQLRFGYAAFDYIFNYLMRFSWQTLNAIETKLLDTHSNKNYRLFEIKRDNIEYAPFDEPCIVSMVLRENDLTWHVFQKTPIEDNWQNWFNKDPLAAPSDKEHPAVAYMLERKPKFLMVAEVAIIYIVGILSVGTILAFDYGKEFINKILGLMYFCPSPYIRTYLQNVCLKYGFTMDTMFDVAPGNKYQDVVLFYPVEDSYRQNETMEAGSNQFRSPSRLYLWNNRTALPVVKFLNMLKRMFVAEWYITPNNQLVFKQKDYFLNLPPLYDFTVEGAEKFFDFKYTFNGKKKPAYGNYSWRTDPMDSCTNEIQDRYKTIVDFDGSANNPMLEGNITKEFDFAGTAFARDGTAPFYIEEAVRIGRLIAVGAVVVGIGRLFLASNFITAAITIALCAIGYALIDSYLADFTSTDTLNGRVRCSSKEINVMRLLDLLPNDDADPFKIHSLNMDDARVKEHFAPQANIRYNPELVNYYQAHPSNDGDHCDVDGAEPWEWVGCNLQRIYNYQLYVDEKFCGNLYSNALEIENPIYAMEINQDFTLSVDLCEFWQDLLGVWENDYAKIGAVLVLEKRGDQLIKGRINYFDIDEQAGKITIKGTIIEPQILRSDCDFGNTPEEDCATYFIDPPGIDDELYQVYFTDCYGIERHFRYRPNIPEFPFGFYICTKRGTLITDNNGGVPGGTVSLIGSNCSASNFVVTNEMPGGHLDVLGMPNNFIPDHYDILFGQVIRSSHGYTPGNVVVFYATTLTEDAPPGWVCIRLNGHFMEEYPHPGGIFTSFATDALSGVEIKETDLLEIIFGLNPCVHD